MDRLLFRCVTDLDCLQSPLLELALPEPVFELGFKAANHHGLELFVVRPHSPRKTLIVQQFE